MRLKLLFITIALLTTTYSVKAQDDIYWSGSSANGQWDWGNGCTTNAGGNWHWSTSGTGDRARPDCNGTFNIIKFNNGVNTTMNLNSGSDFSVNQMLFLTGTPDRIIGSDVGRRVFFQNNNGNCKIENYVTFTTHTFNVDIFVNSGGNNMEINPVYGYLLFNNTVRNNSDNAINIYGEQQVTFTGDIVGTPGVTINNTATVVYAGTSKTYSGTTTINSGTKLKISSNQTLGNIALNGGTLQIDSDATLTITGTYSSTTGSIIDNKGTIKFAGGSVTFPGNATVNNGVANTLAGFEVASLGTVTLNSLLRVTNSITVSSGTLLLGINDLRLNNAPLNIATSATFDNGGENQIINETGGVINISGNFITRDKDGFVGSNTAIPSITPNLNAGSTVEYGLNGNQAVQGLTAPSYSNVSFSGSGTKTLISGNDVSGTITVSGTAIFDASNFTFGGSGTNITMTGNSIYKLGGSGTKPTSNGTYSLGALSTIEFTGTSATNIRLSVPTINYANIIVSGTNVSNSGTSTGIKFQVGGTFTVKNGATFNLNTTDGFSGGAQTSISNVNSPTITLEPGSTIEYAGANQNITAFLPSYSNLNISGTGIKTSSGTNINISNDLTIESAQLTIGEDQTFVVANNINNSGGTLIIENNGSLVQVNDSGINTGAITYERTTPEVIRTDYTYWASPVSAYSLGGVSQNLTMADKYYSYDSSVEDWKQESSATIMDPGIGYIIRGPEPTPPNPPVPDTFDAFFIGKPNNGLYTITGISAYKSYLLGNPYPSALDADTFLAANSGVLDGTLYFWTHKTPLNLAANIPNPGLGWAYTYSLNDYAAYNLTGGVGIDDSILGAGGFAAPNGGTIPTGKIASGQGFFASSKTIISGADIVFNNSMRVGVADILEEDNSQFFKTRNSKEKTSKTIEKHRIWLNLTNTQGAFKQTLIGYITDATNEYDSRFDGESFDGNEFVDFYSVNQEKNLVIQGRALPFNENDEVPLGYRTTIEGDFTIKIDQVDGVLTNQSVFIEDKLTNIVFDLKSGNYTFNTVAGTFNDRFILRYTNKTLGTVNLETLENQVLVSNKNKQIKVNSAVETIDKVLVYDLLGRQIFKKEKVNSIELTIPNLNFSQQIVLVKVALQNGRSVTKKIVY